MRSVYCFAILPSAVALLLVGCVSSGKFHAMQRQAHLSDSLYTQSMRTLKSCQDDNGRLTKDKSTLTQQNKDINLQLTAVNEVNGQLRKQMATLSAVSSAQAESIKRSLDNMGARDSYMIALHSAIASRDSANLAILLYLKQAIGGYGEQNVSIKLEKGAVNVDLSDSLLFEGDSTGYEIGDKAKPVLSRLARALNDLTDVGIVIEASANNPTTPADSGKTTPNGMATLTDSVKTPSDSMAANSDSLKIASDTLRAPTDSLKILANMLTTRTDSIRVNWDLALKRAAAIVRNLQNDHVSPLRMTAAGVISHSANYPIRIHFLPKTEALMQLLQNGQTAPTPPPSVPAVSGT